MGGIYRKIGRGITEKTVGFLRGPALRETRSSRQLCTTWCIIAELGFMVCVRPQFDIVLQASHSQPVN